MTTRKRNEWLEPELSEDEEGGYDSEDEGRGRGSQFARRVSKRRKIDIDSEEESIAADDEQRDQEENSNDEAAEQPQRDHTSPDRIEPATKDAQSENPLAHENPNPKLKPLTPKQLAAAQKKAKKTGVIYISRVPPLMKPQTVRRLLCQYGEIGRIFLTPEDSEAHKRRVKAGGNKRRSFVDGWVEFIHKKDAKIVAETLNTQIIGGKKGGYYYDDIWNIKYLKGFKWHHLTEQIANENAERAARLRAEIAQTTKENKLFLQNVERAKMLEGMEAKRKKKEASAQAV